VNATTIVSSDDGAYNNIVELLAQQPDWSGVHVNTQESGGELYLIDTELPGYYYFDPDPFDLGGVYECILSSYVIAFGTVYQRLRDFASIRGERSIRGSIPNDIRGMTSIRGSSSIRGIDPSDWTLRLEISKSLDGAVYGPWESFISGKHVFRFIRSRLYLESRNPTISPRVPRAELLIDMPDRYERGEDVSCPPSGLIVTYPVPFLNNPAVNITLQNGAVDDRLEFVYKSSAGFQVKVYQATAAGYVTRTLDYISGGYGRVLE
jgi:hypothetical protein